VALWRTQRNSPTKRSSKEMAAMIDVGSWQEVGDWKWRMDMALFSSQQVLAGWGEAADGS
jgi:hypothetical protein